jgi:hypothetical protein
VVILPCFSLIIRDMVVSGEADGKNLPEPSISREMHSTHLWTRPFRLLHACVCPTLLVFHPISLHCFPQTSSATSKHSWILAHCCSSVSSLP